MIFFNIKRLTPSSAKTPLACSPEDDDALVVRLRLRFDATFRPDDDHDGEFKVQEENLQRKVQVTYLGRTRHSHVNNNYVLCAHSE